MLKSNLEINEDISRKLLIDLKEGRIQINEYRQINRGLNTILNYLHVEIESETNDYDKNIR